MRKKRDFFFFFGTKNGRCDGRNFWGPSGGGSCNEKTRQIHFLVGESRVSIRNFSILAINEPTHANQSNSAGQRISRDKCLWY